MYQATSSSPFGVVRVRRLLRGPRVVRHLGLHGDLAAGVDQAAEAAGPQGKCWTDWGNSKDVGEFCNWMQLMCFFFSTVSFKVFSESWDVSVWKNWDDDWRILGPLSWWLRVFEHDVSRKRLSQQGSIENLARKSRSCRYLVTNPVIVHVCRYGVRITGTHPYPMLPIGGFVDFCFEITLCDIMWVNHLVNKQLPRTTPICTVLQIRNQMSTDLGGVTLLPMSP